MMNRIPTPRLLAATFLIAAVPHSTFSQIQIGPRAGMTRSTFSISNVAPGASISYKTGFAAGAVIQIPLSSILSVNAEVMYTQEGEETDIPYYSESMHTTVRTDYLQVPVFIKASLPGEPFNPYAIFGPYVGYLLTAKYETTFAGRSEEFDVKSDYSDIDLGFDLGGGVQYRLAPRIAVVLDLRYSIGVLNIKNGSGTIRTRGIQIIGGVLITVT